MKPKFANGDYIQITADIRKEQGYLYKQGDILRIIEMTLKTTYPYHPTGSFKTYALTGENKGNTTHVWQPRNQRHAQFKKISKEKVEGILLLMEI
jgi:hypothetical protein